MSSRSIFQIARQWFLVLALLGFGLAIAQSEPSLKQIYAAAQAGQLEQAQVMVQQVLVLHPNSAKAYFVQSELYARQGKLARARDALAHAEKIAPGLPFAKPEAVQALRAQLLAKPSIRPTPGGLSTHDARSALESTPSSMSWGLPLLLAGGVIVLGYFLFRRRDPGMAYAGQSGLSGPQTFGMGGPGPMAGPMQAGYGQPAYGPPAESGLGAKIMGGVATGLAVGAGVMAAQAIGRNLMGHQEPASRNSDGLSNNDYQPLVGNTDMGGQDFGIQDTSSWDNSGDSMNTGGSGDWDN